MSSSLCVFSWFHTAISCGFPCCFFNLFLCLFPFVFMKLLCKGYVRSAFVTVWHTFITRAASWVAWRINVDNSLLHAALFLWVLPIILLKLLRNGGSVNNSVVHSNASLQSSIATVCLCFIYKAASIKTALCFSIKQRFNSLFLFHLQSSFKRDMGDWRWPSI